MRTEKDRVLAVLNSELADRPSISTWCHSVDKKYSGSALFVETMLGWHHTYDWDYVKLQPRVSYYEEAWGNVFGSDGYEGVLPECVKESVGRTENPKKIAVLPGDHGSFAEQIEAVKAMQGSVTDGTPTFQTMMCPTSTLRKLHVVNPIGRYHAASRDNFMVTLMHEQPDLARRTLKNITDTMAAYSQKMIDNGLLGVLYGATDLSRSTYLAKEEWEELVKPYDPMLMEVLKPCKIMMYVCGLEVDPEYFAHYLIDILHWSESVAGNPSPDSAPSWLDRSIMPVDGCDRRLLGQHKVGEIGIATRHALERMKEILFILTLDCSLALDTYDGEPRVFIAAAHE